MTSLYKDIKEVAFAIRKEFDIPMLLGGPHPTFYPEVLDAGPFDMICRGEGEFALPDLLDAIDAGDDYSHIQNIWIKRDGKVIKNDLRPLIDPLDQIPLIDWSCYKGTGVENTGPLVYPIRGCPYSCSYCFNEAARHMYKGLGKYIRYLSVERTIAEIQEALRFFSCSPVFFTSDSFGMDLDWMESLFDAYTASTDRPFFLLLRPELVTERCVDILARHNCCGVGIGVESGSERVRREILNRHYTNEQLLDVAKRLHAKGIKFRTYNMLGLPTETEDELWETIDLNVQMKTDFPRGAVYMPMPQTKILDLARREALLDADFSFEQVPSSVFMSTVFKNVDGDRIENSLFFFVTAIKFPWLRPLIRRLTHTKPNALYKVWFYTLFIYSHRKSEQRKWIPYIKYLIANRSSR